LREALELRQTALAQRAMASRRAPHPPDVVDP
jgi:hypothetical protein